LVLAKTLVWPAIPSTYTYLASAIAAIEDKIYGVFTDATVQVWRHSELDLSLVWFGRVPSILMSHRWLIKPLIDLI
jgi:hypothetical protein